MLRQTPRRSNSELFREFTPLLLKSEYSGIATSKPYITMTSWSARWRLKSPASGLFTQPFIQGADQRKHQSSASLAFVRGIHRWPVNSQHKGPVTRKMFPYDDVIMSPRFFTNNTRVAPVTVPSITPPKKHIQHSDNVLSNIPATCNLCVYEIHRI